jgi:hypothetical protein
VIDMEVGQNGCGCLILVAVTTLAICAALVYGGVL